MKTKAPFIVLFILLSSSAWSQEVAFGIKGGLNLASLNVNDAEATYNSRTGLHAGIFARSKFNKVAIQPELLLFTQATDVKSTLLGNYKDNFTYLSIPLMLKFYPVLGLNLQAGPQFGFLLDGERNYSGALGQGSKDIKDYYNNSDVSVSVGTGWDFKFGLSADVRYNIGVKDINNAVDGQETKSKVFLVSLGWNFLK
jgi:hypothetical protein